MKKVIYLFAAALLVGCSTDELSNNGGAIAPPSGEAASSGTVKFTNNTSMTIGSGSAMSRAAFLTRGAAFDVDGNAACQLDIEQVEENRDGASIVAETRYESDGVTIADIKDISGKDVIIEEGVVSRIGELNFQYARTLNKTVFVHGTFDVNNVESNGNGRIVVYPGGVLNYNMDAVDNLTIICYEGATVNFAGDVDITADGKVKVGGDLDLGEGTIGVEGQLYVGGNLTCKNISSSTDDAQIHVIGNLTANAKLNEAGNWVEGCGGNPTFTGNCDVCVEGAMTVYSLTASTGANLHTGCKLVATDKVNSSINITNGAQLWTSYVETPLLHVSGGALGALTNVYLSDGGVVNVDKLNLGNSMLLAAYGDGKALVSAKAITVENRVAWEDVVAPNLYVNYGEMFADAEPADKSMVNVATINGGEAECNPGFTVGGDEPDPEPEPEPTPSGDIVLEIPTWVLDVYTVRADDFAIRVNGVFVDGITVDGSTASLGNIKISEDDLTISLSGINADNIEPGKDYTYEVWLWVNNTNELGNGPLFNSAMYTDWVNPDYDPYDNDEFGCDITPLIKDDKVYSPAGFDMRYNVYRGLAGRVDAATGWGDTPYIKVSIIVKADPDAAEDTNVGIYPALPSAE